MCLGPLQFPTIKVSHLGIVPKPTLGQIVAKVGIWNQKVYKIPNQEASSSYSRYLFEAETNLAGCSMLWAAGMCFFGFLHIDEIVALSISKCNCSVFGWRNSQQPCQPAILGSTHQGFQIGSAMELPSPTSLCNSQLHDHLQLKYWSILYFLQWNPSPQGVVCVERLGHFHQVMQVTASGLI